MGKDLRVAVPVSGRRNLSALHESGDSRPEAILEVRDVCSAPRPSDPGPDAELRVPAEPKPSRCHAQRELTLFSPLSCLPTLSEGIPDVLQSRGSSLATYLPSSVETPNTQS